MTTALERDKLLLEEARDRDSVASSYFHTIAEGYAPRYSFGDELDIIVAEVPPALMGTFPASTKADGSYI